MNQAEIQDDKIILKGLYPGGNIGDPYPVYFECGTGGGQQSPLTDKTLGAMSVIKGIFVGTITWSVEMINDGSVLNADIVRNINLDDATYTYCMQWYEIKPGITNSFSKQGVSGKIMCTNIIVTSNSGTNRWCFSGVIYPISKT